MPKATKIDLDVLMSDGSVQNVNFTIPDGEQGPAGHPEYINASMRFNSTTTPTNSHTFGIYHNKLEVSTATVSAGGEFISLYDDEAIGTTLALTAGTYDLNFIQSGRVTKNIDGFLDNNTTIYIYDKESIGGISNILASRVIDVPITVGNRQECKLNTDINMKFVIPEDREAYIYMAGNINQYSQAAGALLNFAQNRAFNSNIQITGFKY